MIFSTIEFMNENKKKIKKHINVLQAFGFISCALLIGTLVTIKILYGSQFHILFDFLSFVGLVILMSILTIPFTILVYWLLSLKYDLDEDIYEMARKDGERSHK